MAATGYKAKVEYSTDGGTTYIAISGKTTVKNGDITINQVDYTDLDNVYTSSTPGAVKYDVFSLDVLDAGTNYSDLVAIAAARTVAKWRFTRGPAATGDTTLSFDGYIAQVGGTTMNADNVMSFPVQIRPTGQATLGTVA